MAPFLDWLLAVLLFLGGALCLIGSFGLAKLSDFYKRLHGPTKATTLGVGCILVVSSAWFTVGKDGVSLHEILITVFLFVTAPVSAHVLAKAALKMAGSPRRDQPSERGEDFLS